MGIIYAKFQAWREKSWEYRGSNPEGLGYEADPLTNWAN